MIHVPPHDPSVPALQMLLGAEAREIAVAAGHVEGFEVEQLVPSQVRYSPGRSVVVQYRSKITDAEGRPASPMLVAVSGIEVPRDSATVLSDGDATISFWRFPRDPFLPGLAPATDPSRTSELLARLGLPNEASRLRTRAYRATRRAVVEAAADDGSIFMKILRPNRIEALQRRHEGLAPFLPIPRSLGWSKSLGIVAMQALSGQTLRSAIESGQQELPSPQALIDLLDRFPEPAHGATTVQVAYKRAPDHQHLIGTVLPETRGILDELANAIEEAGSSEPMVPVHGDFHSSQVLVQNGQIVGLVDVDTAGIAQRVDDLANMVGQLSTLSVLAEDPRALNSYIAILATEFDRHTDPRTLRLRTAAVVLGLATGPFRVQLSDWPHETVRRLELARTWTRTADSGEIPHNP